MFSIKNFVAVLIAASFLFLSQGVTGHAGQEALSGDKLRKAVTGRTIYLATPFGIELPIRYRANGTMVGKGQMLASFMSRKGVATDKGKWWIAKDQLCQKWQNWLEGKSYCFSLKQKGTKVTWVRNDGRRGTARIGK